MEFNPRYMVRRTLDKTGNLLLSPPLGGLGQIRNHGSRQRRTIALTFDDGPCRPCTAALLDAMAELKVKGTFFCVGLNTISHPDLVARTYAEGHEIGNHSMRHLRKEGVKLGGGDHIDQAAREITSVIGCEPRLYRPPWGWLTPWEGYRLHKRGYTIVGWDVYTLDWQIPEPDGQRTAETILSKTRPGSIILLHDAFPGVALWDKKQTIRAVQQIVPALRAEGYEFVTVSELLNVPAYAPTRLLSAQMAS